MTSAQDAAASLPHILVVIPTRNRPADLERCLESLAAVVYPSWKLLIVDQSDGDATRPIAEAYRDCLPALTYHRTQDRGLCRTRKVALERAGTGIVAYLDDDCTVAPQWLAAVAAAFDRHPNAILVFGSLHAAPHDPMQVFLPAVVFDRERELRGPLKHAELGMGASMYLWPARSPRRHRFDVYLGAGARWPAADERDYACRVLLSGEPLVLTSAIHVQHHGARSRAHGAAGKLFRGYMLADGAMDMKMIRCGDIASVWRVLSLIRIYTASLLSALVTGRRPLGLGRLVMYVRGLAESFLLPVDRSQRHYRGTKLVVRRG